MIKGSDQFKIVYITLSFGNAQAATKTIGEEDKYFSRVSLRSVTSYSYLTYLMLDELFQPLIKVGSTY